jgi:hypothetical protein
MQEAVYRKSRCLGSTDRTRRSIEKELTGSANGLNMTHTRPTTMH